MCHVLAFRAREGSGRRCPAYPWRSQSRSRRRSTALPVHVCSGHGGRWLLRAMTRRPGRPEATVVRALAVPGSSGYAGQCRCLSLARAERRRMHLLHPWALRSRVCGVVGRQLGSGGVLSVLRARRSSASAARRRASALSQARSNSRIRASRVGVAQRPRLVQAVAPTRVLRLCSQIVQTPGGHGVGPLGRGGRAPARVTGQRRASRRPLSVSGGV